MSVASQLAEVFASERIDGIRTQAGHPIQRVAIFAEAFLPKVDGVTRTALLTIKYLQATGRQILIFAPAPSIPCVGESAVYAIPSLPLPFNPDTRAAPPWPLVWPALRRFQPDLIHLFSPFGMGSIGMLAGGWLAVPIVANYQTDLPAYARSYGLDRFRQPLIEALRYLHNGCTLTLAPSSVTLAELRSWGFHRLRFWGRGVDAVRFNPRHRDTAWRARLLNGRDARRFVALYVGRLAQDKHIETLHELARHPAVALTLIGDGSYRAILEARFRDTDAVFMGMLLGDDLARAYASADAFVFPGPEETFGQVVLEAMASGLPVIVVDRGGPQSMIRDGNEGFICPVDSSSAFLDRVARLQADPVLRAHMSGAARLFAEAHPWDIIMNQLEDHYAEAHTLQARLQAVRRA